MPWIHHPATQGGPVSLWRWLQFQCAQIMQRIGYRGRQLEYRALYPGETDNIPF